MIDNPYKILQVSHDASPAVIKAAYRTLLKEFKNHPDLGGDESVAQSLNLAYSTLLDPKQRRNIDLLLQSTSDRFQSVRVYCLQCGHSNVFHSEKDIQSALCDSCGRPFIKSAKHSRAANSKIKNNVKEDIELVLFLYSHRLYMRAIEHINNLLQTDPTNTELLYFMGMCHYNLHRYKEASQAFLKNTQFSSDHYLSQLYLGKTLMHLKQYSLAISHLRVAVRLREGYIKPLVILANCYFRSAKYLDAAKCFEKILEKDPVNEQAYFLWGVSKFKEGEFKQAKIILKKGMEIFPNNHKFSRMLRSVQNF